MSAPAEPSVTPIRIAEQPAAGMPFTAYPPGTPGARALCLEVPIRALGYHVRAENGAEILQREPFEEESITMLLLARGAVIRLATPVARGQNLMLLNKETNKYIHCRVANIRTSPEVKKYVEVEFTHTAPNFWGISFPKEAVKAAAAESAPQMPAGPHTEPSAEALWVVPKKALAAAIGAAPAMAAVAVPVLTPERPAAIPPSDWAPLQGPDESPSPEPFFLPLPTEGLALCEPVLAQVEETPVPPPTMKRDSPRKSAPRSRRARRAIAATAVLCAVYWGYHIYVAGEEPAAAANPAVTIAAPATESRGDDPAAGPSAAEAPDSMNTVTDLAPEVSPVEQPRPRDILISKMAMPVHNMASAPQDAPEITVSAGGEKAPAALRLNGDAAGATSGLLSATGPEPPPPPLPAPAPEKAGTPTASLTPARLVSSVQPIYPSFAKQAHIEGNVTIEAQIDASGKVAGMKVLSGPRVLREAATSAVAKWKFQPAQLGDQPTPISVILTVRFVLR